MAFTEYFLKREITFRLWKKLSIRPYLIHESTNKTNDRVEKNPDKIYNFFWQSSSTIIQGCRFEVEIYKNYI